MQHCPEYEREWHLAEAAKDAGHLAEARAHYAASGEAARRCGVEELVERALCNEAAVAFEMGDVDELLPSVRQVLMRNLSAVNCFLAARHIARAYELRREHKKGLFYARLALTRAETLERPAWTAAAINQIGNCQLGDSLFEEAARSYRDALALVPAEDTARELTYLTNLGYCEVMLGQHRRGLRLIYRTLRTARARGWRRLEMIGHVDLCYAHLELDRFADAERHGRRGLALAEELGEPDWVKNALYLLGQVAVLAGESGHARTRFGELQRRFYPDQPYLSEFLVGVDVRGLVNLRA